MLVSSLACKIEERLKLLVIQTFQQKNSMANNGHSKENIQFIYKNKC